jgi:hypothetical protein
MLLLLLLLLLSTMMARRVCVIQERKSQQKGETTMRLSNFSRIGRFLDLREEHVIFTSKGFEPKGRQATRHQHADVNAWFCVLIEWRCSTFV